MKTPTFYRQRLLLALLAKFENKLSKLDMQKLLFLFMQENHSKSKAYEFVPYHYGCYSFQANADIKTLQNYGIVNLDADTKTVQCVANYDPANIIKKDDQKKLDFFWSKYKGLSGDDLIAYVYKNYPYYTLNSKIAHKYLANKYTKQPTLIDISDTNLFTIGYESITFENYLNKLIDNDIQVLCDVRKNPFSMKFGFSKNMLKHTVEQIGIEYLHLPELGIESENRQELNNLDDYKKLFAVYETTTLQSDEASKALEMIQKIATAKKIALTCFEKDIEYCHRGCIAKELKHRYELGYNNIS